MTLYDNWLMFVKCYGVTRWNNVSLFSIWGRDTLIVPDFLNVQRMVERLWWILNKRLLRDSSIFIPQCYFLFAQFSHIFMVLFWFSKTFFHLKDCLFDLLFIFLTLFENFVRKFNFFLKLLSWLFVN